MLAFAPICFQIVLTTDLGLIDNRNRAKKQKSKKFDVSYNKLFWTREDMGFSLKREEDIDNCSLYISDYFLGDS